MLSKLSLAVQVFILFLFSNRVLAQIQQEYWFLGKHKIDMRAATLTKEDITQTNSLYSGVNAAYDNKGIPLFTIYNNHLYGRDGEFLYNFAPIIGISHYRIQEFAVVPFLDNNINDECSQKRYYVFYNEYSPNDPNGQPYPGFTHLFCLIVTYNPQSNTTTFSHLSNNGVKYRVAGSIHYQHANPGIAVSKLINGTRRLYFLTISGISKVTIGQPNTGVMGLSPQSFIYTTTNHPNFFVANELELSHDGTKLAWNHSDNSYPYLFYVLSLDVNGDWNNAPVYSFSVTCAPHPDPDGIPKSPRGGYLEFDASGNTIFITTGSDHLTNGVYYHDLITQTTSPIIATFGSYGASQIELAQNGYIYAACGVCSGSHDLIAIDPLTKTINYNATIDLEAASVVNDPLVAHNHCVALPDQIDGENYSISAPINNFDYTTITISSQAELNNYFPSFSARRVSNLIQFTNPNPAVPLNLFLASCNIEMGTNAEIRIGPGVNLTCEIINLRATDCGQLWKGIELQYGSSLLFQSSNLRDAKIGIVSNAENSNLSAAYSAFNANRVHIQLNNPGNLNAISYCSFNGTTALKTGSAIPEYTLSAIELISNQFVQSPAAVPIYSCSFTGGKYGIYVKKTNSVIEGSSFSNMATGTAIYADMINTPASLFVGCHTEIGSPDDLAAAGNTFNNIYQAVVAKNKTNVIFRYNTVSNARFHALDISRNNDCKTDISYNSFIDNPYSSVFLNNNAGTQNNPNQPNASKIDVNFNQFTYPNLWLFSDPIYHQINAITVSEDAQTPLNTYATFRISGNYISRAGYGIKTFNVAGNRVANKDYYTINRHFRIDKNTIDYYATTGNGSKQLASNYNSGIQLNNTEGLVLGENNISTSVPHSWRNRGIHSNNSAFNLFYNNTLKAGRGISGMDNATWNDYKCNTFNLCHTGLSYGDHVMRTPGEVHGKPNIESRDNTYNKPLSAELEIYVWNYGSGTHSVTDMNQILSRNQTLFAGNNKPDIVADPYPSLFPPSPGNSILRGGNAPNLCNTNTDPNDPGEGIIPPPPSDDGGLQDGFTNWQWKYLYEKQQKQAGQVADVFINKFLTLEELVAAGDYAAALPVLASMQATNTYEANIINVFGTIINSHYPEERVLTGAEMETMQLIATAHPRTGGNAVYTARAYLCYTTGQVFVDVEWLNRPLGLAAQLNFKTCMPTLPAGLEMKLIDNNNTIYDTIVVYIDTSGFVFIAPQQIAALDTNLLYSFIYTSGSYPAVPYKSLSWWMDNGVQQIGLCSFGKRGYTQPLTEKQQTTAASAIHVYPNPATELVHVLLPEGRYSIELSTPQGKVLYSETQATDLSAIQTKGMAEGLYLVKVKNSLTGKAHTQKLLIIK